MGFNFGAFLGGAASQIVEDIDEQEKEVKLRTRNILDRQVAQTLANQKEYKAKKEKVQNQMNALVPLFGGGADAIAKARSIVAGGDNHYNFMFNKLVQAQDNNQNVNDIYSLIPNKNAVGFKNVEEATDSLVTMAELPEIKLGESTGIAKLFGIDQKAYYDKERKVLEEVGQIQSATASVPEKGEFAQGKLDLSKMKKVFKSADEFEANLLNDINKFEVGTKEHDAATKKYEEFRVRKAKTSAGYITEELRQKNEKNKNAITYGYVQKGWLEGKEDITDKYGARIEIGGKTYLEGTKEYNNYVQSEIDAYNKEFVQSILDDVEGGNLRTNGIKLIQSTVELKKIANQIQKDKLKGDDDKDEDKKVTDPFAQADKIKEAKKKENRIKEFKNKYTTPEAGAQDLVNKGIDRKDILFSLQEVYPDVEQKDLVNIIVAAESEKERLIKSEVPPRPKGGFIFDSDEEKEEMRKWDEQYGKTHRYDGTPKGSPKKKKKRNR